MHGSAPDSQRRSRTDVAGAARERIIDEVGDVGIALLLLCDRTRIDLGEAIAAKLAKNRGRYPVDKARGKAERP